MRTDTAEVGATTLFVCFVSLAIAGAVFFFGYQAGQWDGKEQMRLEATSRGYGVRVPGKLGEKPAWRWIEPDGE